jgi:hypothetical protein
MKKLAAKLSNAAQQAVGSEQGSEETLTEDGLKLKSHARVSNTQKTNNRLRLFFFNALFSSSDSLS